MSVLAPKQWSTSLGMASLHLGRWPHDGAEGLCYIISKLCACCRLDARTGPDSCPATAAKLEKEMDRPPRVQWESQPTLVYEGRTLNVILGFISCYSKKRRSG